MNIWETWKNSVALYRLTAAWSFLWSLSSGHREGVVRLLCNWGQFSPRELNAMWLPTDSLCLFKLNSSPICLSISSVFCSPQMSKVSWLGRLFYEIQFEIHRHCVFSGQIGLGHASLTQWLVGGRLCRVYVICNFNCNCGQPSWKSCLCHWLFMNL